MSYFKFNKDDIFTNTIETYPEYSFYIHGETVYIDNHQYISGSYLNNIKGVPKNFISLYEYNINREESQKIYPFITKGGLKITTNNVSAVDYNTKYGFDGDVLNGKYCLSASITRIPINTHSYKTINAVGGSRQVSQRFKINSLATALKSYSIHSHHYLLSSSYGNKETQDINMINIPYILYGSKIKKGSLRMKYYLSGTLVGELHDEKLNGELIQVGPYGSNGSGSVAGVALYNEGILLLTGSWALESNSVVYDGSAADGSWYYFGMGANDGQTQDNTSLSASFLLEYKGVNRIETINMFCHTSYSDLNHSNNPTFGKDSISYTSGSQFYEGTITEPRNIVSSSITDHAIKSSKITYVSKIAVYDKDRNLLGIAQLAKPVKKTLENQYTFKLKLDI